VTDVDSTAACPSHGISLPAGTRTLRGNDALSYVRERYVLGDKSDLTRLKRQQAFIASMASEVISADTLTSPSRLVELLNSVTSSLTVDKGLGSVAKLTDLAGQFQDTGLNKIQFFTVPIATDPQNPTARVVWTPEATEVWQRIAEDKPIPGRLKAGLIKASSPTGGSAKSSGGPSLSASPDGPAPTPEEEAEADELRYNGLCA
jgi:anionic cell wall polymer biosynthesis LytR-Cps2A-Psr (LCP) family protein